MTISPADFEYVAQIVRARSGIVLEPGKEYLVEARLSPWARIRNAGPIDELIADLRLQKRGELETAVVDALTTNETSFFRDVHPFEALRTTIIPELIEKRSTTRKLSIWCAAASSGQEPYSLAMMLRENFPQLASWNIDILATDLSPSMIERCASGVYSQLEMNRGLPALLLVKYFTKTGTTWEIDPSLRNAIDFRLLNLAEPWPNLPRFDLVMIRNVLIYFDIELKKTILGNLKRVMTPDAYLFLGSAETTLSIDSEYERVTIDRATAYRLAEGAGK